MFHHLWAAHTVVRHATEQDVILKRGSTPRTTAKVRQNHHKKQEKTLLKKNKTMDELREWQRLLRKNRHRHWNKPDVPQFHKAEYEYAKRKGVTCVYVDIETGEIMQFGASKSLELHKAQWDGMFPSRKMQAIYTKDYESFIEELKNKKSKK